MARASGNSNNSDNGKVSGKIKFVMLEAEIDNGNINEIMQAIGAAVRPQTIIQQILPPATSTNLIGSDSATVPAQALASDIDSINSSDESSDQKTKPEKIKGDTQQRVYPQPKPINGINWNGNGIPLEEFAKAKKPDGHINRFVVIAAWFRLHGNLPSVTLAHIFTAYQMVTDKWKWETDKDMAQTFRDGMRPQKRWYEGDNKGSYTINDVGLKAVKNMGGDAKYDTQNSLFSTSDNEKLEEVQEDDRNVVEE